MVKCNICRRRKATQVVVLRWEEDGKEFIKRELICEEDAKFINQVAKAAKVEKIIFRPAYV